jgi:hypothetical protein
MKREIADTSHFCSGTHGGMPNTGSDISSSPIEHCLLASIVSSNAWMFNAQITKRPADVRQSTERLFLLMVHRKGFPHMKVLGGVAQVTPTEN